jgi:hypothetical protein
VGIAGGGCLAAAVIVAAVFKNHSLALIVLGVAVVIAVLIAVRATVAAYTSRRSN